MFDQIPVHDSSVTYFWKDLPQHWLIGRDLVAFFLGCQARQWVSSVVQVQHQSGGVWWAFWRGWIFGWERLRIQVTKSLFFAWDDKIIRNCWCSRELFLIGFPFRRRHVGPLGCCAAVSLKELEDEPEIGASQLSKTDLFGDILQSLCKLNRVWA